jgi:hypothetical protein
MSYLVLFVGIVLSILDATDDIDGEFRKEQK